MPYHPFYRPFGLASLPYGKVCGYGPRLGGMIGRVVEPASAHVTVRNATRGTVVGDAIRVARSAAARTVGLLGTRQLNPGDGLWIEHAPSIHMFFMRYAIDAVFVAADGTVTQVVPNLRPWRVVWWARGARDCVELPAGAAAAAGIEVGDRLEIVAGA